MPKAAMSKAAMSNAAMVSLATSVPPHVLLQKDVLAAAWDVFGARFPEFERFSSIFSNTGIIKRHGVKPFDWYFEPRGWPERTAAFLEGAEALFVDVAEKALASAHLTGLDIDTVVTVCSTGIATPSLEARVARRMGFRSDISRVPVFGLGCAGGASGLSIASRLAEARPGSNVLLVTIELCSLALRHDELTKANIVAVSLFGDGFPFEKCCINEHVYRLRANERMSQEYLYFWLTSELALAEMRTKGTGVAIPGLNSTALRSLAVLVPPRPIVEAYTRQAAPLITRLLANARQSRTLATLRDTLLPKLLSGKLMAPGAHGPTEETT